jgi:DNA repair protein RadD
MKNNIVLRPYQEAAVEKYLWASTKQGNDIISIPTAGGKSLIISAIAKEIDKECVILCPNREILEQNRQKLLNYVPEEEIGVYSASFKRRDINRFTLITIQSAYKVPELFEHIDFFLADECHLINQKNKNGMLSSFLREVGNAKVVGFTATPFRNVLGYAQTPFGGLEATTMVKLINRMRPLFWHRLLYNLNTEDLLEQGYVSPIEYNVKQLIEDYKIPVNRSRSDFDLTAFTKLLTPFEGQIADEINKQAKERKAVIVFCASVEQAQRMAAIMNYGDVVTGDTPTKERDRIINDFKSGKIKVVFNVGCLTTGFDFPELDTMFLLRPTRSLNLYQQMCGRLLRIAEGKLSGHLFDYTNTVKNLGKIEDIKLIKEDKWELYANGEKFHNKPLFSYEVKKPRKVGISIGGKKI